MKAAIRCERALATVLSAATGRRAAVALAALLTLACLLTRLGTTPITRSAEQRCDTVARHMVETGEWLVPIEDGAPRLQKPPLFYWAAAAAAAPSGELTRFALRLPSVLAAVLLLGLVFTWGRSLGGFDGGALAGVALLEMAQYWSLARQGVAEMMLVLFSTAALFVFDRIYWGGRRRLLPLFFLASLLAFLAKATTALLLIGLPVALQLALDRRLTRALRRDVLGWAALCACACLAWYAAVLALVPGAWSTLREALLLPLGLTKSVGSAAHVRPIWYFLPLLPGLASPAVWVAPLLLARAPGGARPVLADPRTRFLLIAFAAILLAFSAFPMKQKHYTLPLLPLLALCLGATLQRLALARRDLLLRVVRGLGTAMLVLAPPIAAGFALHLRVAAEGPVALVLAVPAFVLLVGALGFAAGRSGSLRTFAAASLLYCMATFTTFEASVDVWRDRFEEGEVDPASEAGLRWQRLFSDYPPLRRFYRAREWPRESHAIPRRAQPDSESDDQIE